MARGGRGWGVALAVGAVAVVGAAVLGAAVLGATVVGATVLGAPVLGAPALGAPALGATGAAGAAAARPETATATASRTFAGYQVTSTSLASASAVLRVPTLTCGAAFQGFGTGLTLNGDENLSIISFSETTSALVSTVCSDGKATYSLTLYVDNAPGKQTFAIAPGQRLKISLSEKREAAAVFVKDLSNGKTASDSGKPVAYLSANLQAGTQPLDSSSTQAQLAVPKFKGDGLSSVVVDGHPLAVAQPQAFALTEGGKVAVQPSALTGGDSFTLGYLG
jgi:hypothetical protein